MSSDNEVKFKKKKSKKSAMGYVYLFIFVFAAALAFMSYLVKSYSPDVDVEIGNKEDLTLSESDMDVEVKNIDERLKWIQEEDEMPSITLRENKKKNINDYNFEDPIKDNTVDIPKKETITKEPLIPLPEKPKDYNPVMNQASEPVKPKKSPLPAPSPSVTKVYIGSISSLEEAMSIQEKINRDIPEAMPFIKAVQEKYIIQLGSFSKKETADAFISRLREKGYNPKTSEK